jgi:acetyl-CoA C-acetyltransferase
MRIHTGGSTGGSGALAGYQHVASGLFDVVLVVALQRVGESPDAQRILNTIFDPIYEKDFALNVISTIAMQTVRQMQKYGLTERQLAKVSVKNHLAALNNPYAHLKLKVTIDEVLNSRMICWPIRLLDCCPRSQGACAVVMAAEGKAEKITDTPAWIRGVAASADGYFLGDRMDEEDHDYADIPALTWAAERAYQMAGISDPLEEIDVAELYTPFSNTEIAHYEALGFCERGEGGQFVDEGIPEMDGKLPTNPSGGVQTSNPIGATGLVRVAEAALQVMGKAGERQVSGARTALATACGGINQFYTVTILGRSPLH